jgi:LmbE family N-acetylglucosaminyl deacetylase
VTFSPDNPTADPADATTSEADWCAWVADLPELELDARSLIVVTPHPDDETLCNGGLMADLVAADIPVFVVAVTDGDGSHPNRPGLAERRRAEQDEALRRVGVTRPAIRLGITDGATPASVDELTESLLRIVEQVRTEGGDRPGDDVLVAPWELDGHVDHDAAGIAALRAAEQSDVRLLLCPSWAYQWATIDDLTDLRPCRYTISDAGYSSKANAIECFPSQTTDQEGMVIVPPNMVDQYLRPWETYLEG